MRRIALILLLAILPCSAHAESFFLPREQEGAWLRADRQVHFGGSMAISASLRVEGATKEQALVGTFAIGVAKEIWDATLKPKSMGQRGASRRDLVADLLGAAVGVLLVAAIDH